MRRIEVPEKVIYGTRKKHLLLHPQQLYLSPAMRQCILVFFMRTRYLVVMKCPNVYISDCVPAVPTNSTCLGNCGGPFRTLGLGLCVIESENSLLISAKETSVLVWAIVCL
jgi:hypothetical protein